jgi:hypothetical protein
MEKSAEDLLNRARSLKKELRAFGREARAFLRTRPEKPEDELEDLETDMLGGLECLLADDLEPALRKLQELDALLKRASVLKWT